MNNINPLFEMVAATITKTASNVVRNASNTAKMVSGSKIGQGIARQARVKPPVRTPMNNPVVQQMENARKAAETARRTQIQNAANMAAENRGIPRTPIDAARKSSGTMKTMTTPTTPVTKTPLPNPTMNPNTNPAQIKIN